MNHTRKPLDFLYGVFLIGGAPLCAFFLTLATVKSCQKFFKQALPDGAWTMVLITLTLAAFLVAIWQRVRRRVLPHGFIALEIVLGLVWASLAWGWVAGEYFAVY